MFTKYTLYIGLNDKDSKMQEIKGGRSMYKLLTAITLATLVILITAGARAASERRAAYIDTESAYFECIESGLTRSECTAAVNL